MNAPFSGNSSSGPASEPDMPTPEQAAILQYLGLVPTEGITSAQAGALISRSEANPAGREKLAAWHREKYLPHPDLFAPPQRSYREARWWQAKIADGTLYGYSLRQPSIDQTFVILDALDRSEPGWDREGGKRREARFMNELATLSPELCKPGCTFPHDLPEDGDPDDSATAPAPSALSAPSAPSVPNEYASKSLPFTPPSKPAWQPPVQLPGPARETDDAPARGGGGAWKWLALAVVLLAGAGAYFYFYFRPPALEHGGGSVSLSPTDPFAPVAANDSRQRAVAKYPDLAKRDSPLNVKFLAAFHRLETEHDPLLQQPDWPERLAARCAEVSSPSPPPASPSVTAAAALPTPAMQKPAAPSAAPRTTNASTPATSPATSTPAATPDASPTGRLSVTLDAVNKSRVNNYAYRWSSHYYADYDLSFRQTVGIEIKVRNMARTAATVNLRWMFFGRKAVGNERYIFSASQKRLGLAPGQTVADALDSPMLQSTAAVSYNYGTHLYAGSKYDGWLVQVLPDGGDTVLAQVGSSGSIEDFGKRSDLTALLKELVKP